MSNDPYRQALEGLRERCAQEAERITARSRTLAAMINAEAVKPCEVAAAIRKIGVQQHYECAVGQVERDEALLRQALETLEELQCAVVSTAKTDDVSLYYRAIAALRERLGGEKG